MKQGEDEVTTESLEGVTQKAASLEIDMNNRLLLSDKFTRLGSAMFARLPDRLPGGCPMRGIFSMR